MIHEFFVSCVPPKATHQASLRIMRKANGQQFIGKFASGAGKAASNDLLSMLMPHRPPEPFYGPLALFVCWCYPWRKSEKKSNVARGEIPCDTRPDCDNLAKMAIDALTRAGFWTDDGQVAHLSFNKSWGDRPGITVKIENL